jgi:hypothetical protein
VIKETTGYIVGAGSGQGWAAFDVYGVPYAEGDYTSITYLNTGEQYKYSINDEEVSFSDFNTFVTNISWEETNPQVTVEESRADGVNIINIKIDHLPHV